MQGQRRCSASGAGASERRLDSVYSAGAGPLTRAPPHLTRMNRESFSSQAARGTARRAGMQVRCDAQAGRQATAGVQAGRRPAGEGALRHSDGINISTDLLSSRTVEWVRFLIALFRCQAVQAQAQVRGNAMGRQCSRVCIDEPATTRKASLLSPWRGTAAVPGAEATRWRWGRRRRRRRGGVAAAEAAAGSLGSRLFHGGRQLVVGRQLRWWCGAGRGGRASSRRLAAACPPPLPPPLPRQGRQTGRRRRPPAARVGWGWGGGGGGGGGQRGVKNGEECRLGAGTQARSSGRSQRRVVRCPPPTVACPIHAPPAQQGSGRLTSSTSPMPRAAAAAPASASSSLYTKPAPSSSEAGEGKGGGACVRWQGEGGRRQAVGGQGQAERGRSREWRALPCPALPRPVLPGRAPPCPAHLRR